MMLARLGAPLGGFLHRLLRLPSFFFLGKYLSAVFLAIDMGVAQSGAYPVARAHERGVKNLFLSL